MTQWFDPEPTFKGLLFAKELKKAGHDVEVVTGFPNYPGGKVYDGYHLSFYKKEEVDDIVIHRLPIYPSHDQSAIRRIFNYASFGVSSFIGALVKTRGVDVVYSYHPPLTTSLSAVLVGTLKRVPVVVDIQDLWPDTLAATGMLKNKRILGLVGWLCKFVYKRADKIIVLSPGFKARLISRGVPENKVEVIYNWCNESALYNFESSDIRLPKNGNLNLLFAGNLGFAQGLPAVVETAEILQKDSVDVNVVFLGDGVAKAKAQQDAQNKGLTNTFFLPRVSMQQVGGLLAAADMLLVHLKDDELFRITIPSRTQANLAVGKPIVMGIKGDAADLVEKAEAGVICEPDNPESLALGIKTLAAMSEKDRLAMGANAKSFYSRELSVASGVYRFINVFKSVLK